MKPEVRLGWTATVPLLMLALVLASATPAHAQGSSQARAEINQAYASIRGAEQDGGNVSGLVSSLNSAIALLHQADALNQTDHSKAQSLYSQAASIAQQVIQSAPSVAGAGRSSVMNARIALGVETAFLGSLAVAAYLYTPRIFWGFWLRTHRNWRVKKR